MQMKKNFPVVLFLVFIINSCSTSQIKKSALLQNEAKIDRLLSQMTLEEKIGMLHGKSNMVSAGVERLGIADFNYTDGPFGIREEVGEGFIPLGWENDRATFFPTGSALAATWSPELAYLYGTGLAKEAKLRGKDMILGPAVNIQRIPTGGRTYEYLSEDPFLNSRLAVGYTKGVQDNNVAVCVKHFALNNQETNRGKINVLVDERAFREIYLPAFKATVEEADAYGIMPAYNKINGFWCSENDKLLNQILRDEWGFSGMAVSDWGGTHSTVNAIKNGLNVEMPTKKFLGQSLIDSVKAGKVSEELINQRVREILRVRLAIKPVPKEKANTQITSQPEVQKIAYEIACKSIVLLKNDGILPIKMSNRPKIAVIGANATQKMATGGLGAGVKTLYEITPLEGLKDRIGNNAEILFAQGYEPVVFSFADLFKKKTAEEIDKEKVQKEIIAIKLAKEALDVASKADIVIFIAGDNRSVETEGSDRANIFLPSGQDKLITQIKEVNPRIITVLTSGAPNDLNTVKPLSEALLISWFNGSEGGNALADVLIGNISPSGHLPFTLPNKLEDSPAYALGNYPQGGVGTDIFADLISDKGNSKNPKGNTANESSGKNPDTAHYSEESLVGYRWYTTRNVKVAYPFGYGLTYTTFRYSNLNTEKERYKSKETIKLSFEIENTGTIASDEVVQVYVHRINPSKEWPYKELKAFSRISLQPGEKKLVTMNIPVKDLQYWDKTVQKWRDDICNVDLQVGASSEDVKLHKTVTLE